MVNSDGKRCNSKEIQQGERLPRGNDDAERLQHFCCSEPLLRVQHQKLSNEAHGVLRHTTVSARRESKTHEKTLLVHQGRIQTDKLLIHFLIHSLWDGVLSCLDLTEEFLRYAVIKGKLTIQHGEQDHAKSPHITGFATVWPPCKE